MVQPREAILHVIENALLQNWSRDSTQTSFRGCLKKIRPAKKFDGSAAPVASGFVAAIQ